MLSPATQVHVIGSGPNGLAAAIAMARAGCRVTLYERAGWIGGSVSSAALTRSDFVHDVCSSVYPLAAGSPFFRTLRLSEFGFAWSHPDLPLAHPFDDGTAVALRRNVTETAEDLGNDRRTYQRLLGPFAIRWDELARDVLAPPGVPVSPVLMTRFAIAAAFPALTLARTLFAESRTRALFAGLAAHSARPLDRPLTSAFALVLAAAAHAVGWPFALGGASNLAEALASCAREAGVTILTKSPVSSLATLASAQAILCDVTPRHLLEIATDRLPRRYGRALSGFAHGPGVFKLDWALGGPIPWKANACRLAGTVHLGGTLEEIANAEDTVARGRHPERPFVLLTQPTICDPTRAPEGHHTAWAYCHVPSGSPMNMTARIEHQVERFAPGFRDLILARHEMGPAALEAHNPNLVGGDVTGGLATFSQTMARPTWRHYTTPVAGLYLCSASTPPGGGVHGMCGYHAAQAALRLLKRHLR